MTRVCVFATLLIVPIVTAAAFDGNPQQAAWAVIDKSLHSGDYEHRIQTLVALGTIDGANQDAVQRVKAALKDDKDPRVRQQAAMSLGQMKATSAIPDLQVALDDRGEVAFAAAKALTDMGDPAGRPMLVAVLAGDRKTSPGMMTNAVREAQKQMKHPEGLVLMGAEDAAGTMFGPGAMAITAFKDAAHLQGKGAPGRAAAAAYLAKTADPYSVELLEWALNDDSKMVRFEAAKGLGLRGNAGSIAKLEALLSDDHTAVRTMAAASIVRLSNSHDSDRSAKN
jgi:HEAT repeat protein